MGTLNAGDPIEGTDFTYAGASTVSYSVDTYIASMQTKYAGQTSDKALATLNLVNALGNYGKTTCAYVGISN